MSTTEQKWGEYAPTLRFNSACTKEPVEIYHHYYETGAFYFPPFQRSDNRDDDWRAGIIRSLLEGKTLLPIVLNKRSYSNPSAAQEDLDDEEDEEDNEEVSAAPRAAANLPRHRAVTIRRVLDGGHRSRAIFGFLRGDFGVPVKHPKTGETLKLFYQWTKAGNIPADVLVADEDERLSFRDIQIDVIGFTNLDDEQEREVFRDLNKSVPLTIGNQLAAVENPVVRMIKDCQEAFVDEDVHRPSKERVLGMLDKELWDDQGDFFLEFGTALWLWLVQRRGNVESVSKITPAAGIFRDIGKLGVNVLNSQPGGNESNRLVHLTTLAADPSCLQAVPPETFVRTLAQAVELCRQLRLDPRKLSLSTNANSTGRKSKGPFLYPYSIFTQASRKSASLTKNRKKIRKHELVTIFCLLWKGCSKDDIKDECWRRVEEDKLDFQSPWCISTRQSATVGHNVDGKVVSRTQNFLHSIQKKRPGTPLEPPARITGESTSSQAAKRQKKTV